MIRWSALNVSRRKPASSAAIDIERWLQRTLIKARAEHQPKPKAAQTKKTAPVGYTITWRALFFPDNRIFYKAYS